MTGQEHAEAHPPVNYMSIWWYLLVLTVGEVAIVYVGIPRVPLVLALVVFAMVKTFLVAAYFMHLKFEKRVMWVIALAPLIFATILTIGLVPDAEKGHQAPDGTTPVVHQE